MSIKLKNNKVRKNISVDPNLINKVEILIKNNKFKSFSDVMDFAINKLFDELQENINYINLEQKIFDNSIDDAILKLQEIRKKVNNE